MVTCRVAPQAMQLLKISSFFYSMGCNEVRLLHNRRQAAACAPCPGRLRSVSCSTGRLHLPWQHCPWLQYVDLWFTAPMS